MSSKWFVHNRYFHTMEALKNVLFFTNRKKKMPSRLLIYCQKYERSNLIWRKDVYILYEDSIKIGFSPEEEKEERSTAVVPACLNSVLSTPQLECLLWFLLFYFFRSPFLFALLLLFFILTFSFVFILSSFLLQVVLF